MWPRKLQRGFAARSGPISDADLKLIAEAEAAGRVQGMRQRIADKVIAQSQAAIQQLESHLH